MLRTTALGILIFFVAGHAMAGSELDDGANCASRKSYNLAIDKERRYGKEEVRADLAQLLSVVAATHPDTSLSFDQAALQEASRRISVGLAASLNVREAWLEMALLNPHFHDAHTGLRHPVAAYEADLQAGAAAFPLAVFVDRQGVLRVSSKARMDKGIAVNDQIVSINGRGASAIIAELMPRMRGEMASIQRLVLAFNFPGHLWTLLGPQSAFCVRVRSADGRVRPVLLTAAGNDAKSAVTDGAAAFTFSRPARDVAMLRIASFDPGLKDAFGVFLRRSFDELEKERAQTLLIDIRDNPGGAHDVSDQLVGYLTDKAVPSASVLLARITEKNRELAPRADIGSVVRVPFDEPIISPVSSKPFDGDIYVLVSQDTYSQAIVFAAALQDARIARVVGEVTGGNANQTGQISIAPLANTGLQALAPVYVIYRPNGDTRMQGLQPDIPLVHDPLAPERMMEAMLRAIEKAAATPTSAPTR